MCSSTSSCALRWGAFVLVLLGVAACSASTSTTSSKTAEGYDLRLRPDDGSRFVVSRAMDLDMDMTVMGRSMTMKQKQVITLRYDVQSTSDRGGMELGYTATRLQGETSIPTLGQRMTYDTADSTATGMSARLGQRMRALTGHTLTARLAPRGSVQAVTGVEGFLDSLTTASQNSRQAAMMRQMLAPDAVRQQLNLSFKIYPDEPVSVGDSWTNQSTVRMGFPVRAHATYSLDSVNAETAVIDAHVDLKPTQEGDPIRMGGAKMDMDLSGTMNGTIHVDVPSGLPMRHDLSVELSGTGQMHRKGISGQKQSIQMQVNSKGTVKETIQRWEER